MSVYVKLMNVQQELKAPKSQYNSFGKYSYRNCEDILEAAKPILSKNNSLILLNDNVKQIGDRFYIEATVTFVDTESGERIEVNALAREDEAKKGMDLAQVTGSTSSYARKYALNGLLSIDDSKDSDFTNTHDKDNTSKTNENATGAQEQPSKSNNTNTISEARQKRLFAISKGNANVVKEVLMKHGYTSSKDIKTSEYDAICDEVAKKVG